MHDFIFLYESINAKAKTLEQISSEEQREITILFCVLLAKCSYFCKGRFLKSHVSKKIKIITFILAICSIFIGQI